MRKKSNYAVITDIYTVCNETIVDLSVKGHIYPLTFTTNDLDLVDNDECFYVYDTIKNNDNFLRLIKILKQVIGKENQSEFLNRSIKIIND